MLKTVIDTTVWISGIFWHGVPHQILEMWKTGDFEIVVSEAILAEVGRKLNEKAVEFGMEIEVVNEWLDLIIGEGILVRPQEQIRACRDSEDDMFLEAAVEGRADFVVSGDKDLTDMGESREIKLVKPREFYDFLTKERETPN
ncbi:MAG TPA: putative toxin-antitoxin system toxin component, PIN family [Anaerolineae bacterium]|nr:putative toxin-antitoxin system toxin component, PIN family [Anaerolineae bacterium]